MIDLRKDIKKIKSFIEKGTDLLTKTNQEPKVVGIYSSPNYGWISLNFNSTKALEDSSLNCPDFEFVEFNLLELPDWETEYENSKPQITNSKGNIISMSEYFGDGEYKAPFYELLIEIAAKLSNTNESFQYFVQMLDSELNEKI